MRQRLPSSLLPQTSFLVKFNCHSDIASDIKRRVTNTDDVFEMYRLVVSPITSSSALTLLYVLTDFFPVKEQRKEDVNFLFHWLKKLREIMIRHENIKLPIKWRRSNTF